MLLRQVINEDLGCCSYVLARDGVACVVDPQWDITAYLLIAERIPARVLYVIETHVHSDHVSGRGRLVVATGATVVVPVGAGLEVDHSALRDGDVLDVGGIRLEAVHMPGHRPEHTGLVVWDPDLPGEPAGVLTGDSLLVGDVARPDPGPAAEEGTRALHRSLRRLDGLGDHVPVWPGHVAVPPCGAGGTSGRPSSTLGLERRANRALRAGDEDAFVAALGDGGAPRPPTAARVSRLNRGPLIGHSGPLPELSPPELMARIASGAVVVDGRSAEAFDAGHVPGAVSIPPGAGVGACAATVLDPGSAVVAMAESAPRARALAGALVAVGFDNLSGIYAEGVDGWRRAGGAVPAGGTIALPDLARAVADGSVTLLDVREPSERDAGPAEGSVAVPVSALAASPLPDAGTPIVVAGSRGGRTSTAASVVRRRRPGAEVLRLAEGGVADLADQRRALARD